MSGLKDRVFQRPAKRDCLLFLVIYSSHCRKLSFLKLALQES
jgi:hypothetical protein